MSGVPVLIFDRMADDFVEATLHDELDASALRDAETQWKPERDAALRQLRVQRGDVTGVRQVQHLHWNWALKAGKLDLLAYRCCGIHCEGQWQGMMMMVLAGYYARFDADAGKPLVYIDYLETAPWNVHGLAARPRYKLVGVRLIEAAMRVSLEEHYGGRIGLHALPQAERFYEQTCGMTRIGPDDRYEGLVYFETTPAQADRFLAKGA